MKRFVYLVQVPSEVPPALAALEGPDSDVCVLSWRTPVNRRGHIFYPRSSWTQGRNRLLKQVSATDYQYYVFLDGDVHLTSIDDVRDPWREFETFLAEYEPAVGVPRYAWHLGGGALDLSARVQTIRFFDAVVNAFHREALPTLLPYYDLLDAHSECYSQNILCSLAATLYAGHVLQDNRVEARNLDHQRTDHEFFLCRPEDLFLSALVRPEDRWSFLRQTHGVRFRHPTHGEPRRKGGVSYRRGVNELDAVLHAGHALRARQHHLRQVPLDDEFYREGPDTKRAHEWTRVKADAFSARKLNAFDSFVVKSRPARIRLGMTGDALRRRLDPVRTKLMALSVPGLRRGRGGYRRQWARWKQTPRMTFAGRTPLSSWRWAQFLIAETATGDVNIVDVGSQRRQASWWLLRFVPHTHATTIALGGAVLGSRPQYSAVVARRDRGSGGRTREDDPPHDVATIVRQYGLGEAVIHMIAIAPNADAEYLRTLADVAPRCLLLECSAPPTSVPRGFRMLAASPGSQLFVNVDLAERLLSSVGPVKIPKTRPSLS